MANIRMLPSTVTSNQRLTTPRGSIITGTPGSTVDLLDTDAAFAEANGWSRVAEVGTTAARPTEQQPGIKLGAQSRGRQYLDTTVGAIIIWDGAVWRDTSGNTV